MEEGFDPATLDGLRKKGHKISVVDRWSFGSAKVIVSDDENGCWLGGADPAPCRLRAWAIEKFSTLSTV